MSVGSAVRPVKCRAVGDALIWLGRWKGLLMKRQSCDCMLVGGGYVPLIDASLCGRLVEANGGPDGGPGRGPSEYHVRRTGGRPGGGC